MIICHCQVVTDRAIAEAVDAGARTVAQVCRATGAGKGCGSCVFSFKRLLCDDGQHRSECEREVDIAAS